MCPKSLLHMHVPADNSTPYLVSSVLSIQPTCNTSHLHSSSQGLWSLANYCQTPIVTMEIKSNFFKLHNAAFSAVAHSLCAHISWNSDVQALFEEQCVWELRLLGSIVSPFGLSVVLRLTTVTQLFWGDTRVR